MNDGKKTYDSIIAAKYLMALANERGEILNTTKVQKLLYIAYGYFLTDSDHIFINESPKAWPYGPVFPRTRKKVDYSKIVNLNDPELQEISKDEKVTGAFKQIIEMYSKYTANQLSDWSHEEGGAWDKTTKIPGFKWNDPIPDEYIKSYFLQLGAN